MARYRYKACRMDGSRKAGVTEAADSRELLEKLRREGLFCYEYSRVRTAKRDMTGRLRAEDIPFFCRQMSAMLQAGVPAPKALEIVSQTRNVRLRHILERLKDTIQWGRTLSEAMKEMEPTFPELTIRVVAAGEKSGPLPQLLERLAARYSRDVALRRKFQSVMTYPVILFVVTIISAVFLFTSVVPRFGALLSGRELPLLTRCMLQISAALTEHPIFFWLVFLAAGLGAWGIIRIPACRLKIDQMLLRLPAAGRLLRISDTARFASTFSVLYGSGVSVIESLETAANLLGSAYIRQRLLSVSEAVKGGKLLSEAFRGEELFPRAFVSMIAAGEEAGKLELLSEQTGAFYEQEEENALEQLIALAEPCMILVMGLLVGMIVLSVVIPLFSLYSQIL